ncbi:unnamed protein product [Ixodes pacificus]
MLAARSWCLVHSPPGPSCCARSSPPRTCSQDDAGHGPGANRRRATQDQDAESRHVRRLAEERRQEVRCPSGGPGRFRR